MSQARWRYLKWQGSPMIGQDTQYPSRLKDRCRARALCWRGCNGWWMPKGTAAMRQRIAICMTTAAPIHQLRRLQGSLAFDTRPASITAAAAIGPSPTAANASGQGITSPHAGSFATNARAAHPTTFARRVGTACKRPQTCMIPPTASPHTIPC